LVGQGAGGSFVARTCFKRFDSDIEAAQRALYLQRVQCMCAATSAIRRDGNAASIRCHELATNRLDVYQHNHQDGRLGGNQVHRRL